MTESVRPLRFATEISEVKGPFRGRWIYELTPHQGGSFLTLTEFGEIGNPFVRAMFRIIMNKAMFVESYLICLGAKFGEQIVPSEGTAAN